MRISWQGARLGSEKLAPLAGEEEAKSGRVKQNLQLRLEADVNVLLEMQAKMTGLQEEIESSKEAREEERRKAEDSIAQLRDMSWRQQERREERNNELTTSLKKAETQERRRRR